MAMTNIKEKITSKPTKTILFAGLLVTILIPFSTMGYVEADNIKGKTIIKFEKSDSDIPLWEERKHLREVYSQLESESDKALIQKKIDQLSVRISQWYAERFDGDMYNLAREKQDLLGDVLRKERQEIGRESAFESLPWTGMGYDYVDNALEVTIDPKFFTEGNILKYIEKIRSIIGTEVNLTISPKTVATLDVVQTIDSPLKQFMEGIPINKIQCRNGLEFIIKSSNDFPACVTPETKEVLIERGWAKLI
ncbi:MAG: hypothetical protein QXE84_03190 [Candidatus Nitrosotenuis sp.]|uniref:Uncharacterized protein n=2 Tax=Candidatus Nitrosotenuis uzonensis TaxID=1407055 RepID=A0A812F168_9ARCH|nr:hypothetical protein NUZ5A_50272 [Candidatus Nitrosotenuis uzonensis]